MGTKDDAIGDMALIANRRGHLISYADLEAMYRAVVHHGRWWRRVWSILCGAFQ